MCFTLATHGEVGACSFTNPSSLGDSVSLSLSVACACCRCHRLILVHGLVLSLVLPRMRLVLKHPPIYLLKTTGNRIHVGVVCTRFRGKGIFRRRNSLAVGFAFHSSQSHDADSSESAGAFCCMRGVKNTMAGHESLDHVLFQMLMLWPLWPMRLPTLLEYAPYPSDSSSERCSFLRTLHRCSLARMSLSSSFLTAGTATGMDRCIFYALASDVNEIRIYG